MLWVDKYRPNELSTLDYHADVTKRLQNLATSDDLPHLLVYGPSGAGKKTRIMALLRELYGDGALKVRLEHKSFKVRAFCVLWLLCYIITYRHGRRMS